MGSAGGSGRIVIVDLLRGAALFGILAVNIWFFAFSAIGAGVADPGLDGADRAAYGAALLLFAFKSYLLFAFLFGYSFVLQQRDAAFPRRIWRRLSALVVLGALHGVLIFPGDILLPYGLLGFVLLAMSSAPAATSVRRGIGLTAAVGLVMLALGLLVWSAGGGGAPLPEAAPAPPGSIAGVLAQNAERYPSVLFSVLLVQGLPALGAMLCGVGAARRGLFTDPAAGAALWRRLSPWGPAVGTAGAVGYVLLVQAGAPGPVVVAIALAVLTAPLMTATYAALLVAWHRRSPASLLLRAVAAAGRLALSNYLFQSLAMALLFTAYGLQLADRLSGPQVWAVVLLIYACGLAGSTWWLRSHRYGPAEWLLRRWSGAGDPVPGRSGGTPAGA